ncbi:MAG TPA: Flp pilus assembly protein CpaB [Acidothermaceae bacterium]|nr:Flp pilus assembly protein CpaB [Acidothermaceae bacterium]
MESSRGNLGKVGSRRSPVLNSRGGALLIAVACAALAGLLIYLFVSHYNKKAATPPPASVTVFEATRYIPRGTPQASVAAENLLKPVQVSAAHAVLGAISDPSEIVGEVSTGGITAGQQVTAADFSHANITLSSYLTGDQRAIAFSLDATHGLTAYIAEGDTVDIMAQSGGRTEIVAQNVPVLANAGGDVVVRVTDKQALKLAADTGVASLWLTLRPGSGAKESVKLGTVETS